MYTTYAVLVILTLTFHNALCQQYSEAVFLSDDVTYSCRGFVDLVLVVDASAFTRFTTPRGIPIWHPGIAVFVNNLLRVLQVGPASFRVAAILYSTGIDDIMPFSVHQVYTLHTFGFLRPGFGVSATAKGLSEMRKMLSYYGRPDAAKRAILLSASHSNDHQAALVEANLARSIGIDILSVGFGPFRDIGELNEISPGWVLEVPDAGMLYALVGRIAARLCKEAVNGGWSPWLSWTPCSKSCDGGVSRRFRFCNNPLPQYGGSFCTGAPNIRMDCNTQPCLAFFSGGVDWSTWGPCSATCGSGTRSRSRPCLSRSQCRPGTSETGTSTCRMSACPVESTWGTWLSWEPCSMTCGRGVRQRRRKCTDTSPGVDGRCLGPGMDTEMCNAGIACQECERCILGPGGRRYVGCPHDCTRYVQCPAPGYEALQKICPHGQLWSNRQQKCVQPSESECDLCSGQITGSEIWYSCREYWKCESDHRNLHLRCCPDGFHFVPGLGCMKDVDNSCKAECYSRPSLGFQAKNCSYRPSPLGSYWYEEITSDFRKTRACPVGTQFSQDVCQCVMTHELSPTMSFNRGLYQSANIGQFRTLHQGTESAEMRRVL
ncbi:semaphorin-5A-like, partial [Pecten maximus]|uniref:semaphorin-5A-like n=1 Tax=Pecten maximus TaxID=6579 RepID=UPI00145835F4